ncbi:Trm112 family protein [Alteromonas sp. KUL49]|uniref:Trm112 family protein n=1 Tax=Alteromonas sp. KUL49 TaxID=2480798 RepID=UPI00102EE108|nr:Trm112 family protein [Alteromonas sp. KUL49]TAP35883.1 Trm112 family protein [Alteromonas sp. KUL49]GEA13267.1 UPF0434 protein [Alteromonas sp. KUL49]
MAFDNKLLDVIACPVCKGKLVLNSDRTELLCRFDRLAFTIDEGIPVLIEAKARSLSLEEVEASR